MNFGEADAGRVAHRTMDKLPLLLATANVCIISQTSKKSEHYTLFLLSPRVRTRAYALQAFFDGEMPMLALMHHNHLDYQ